MKAFAMVLGVLGLVFLGLEYEAPGCFVAAVFLFILML